MLILSFFIVSVGFVSSVSAELEWKFRKPVPLTSAPLDNAVSTDGQLLYILSPGEIMVYSLTQNKAINTIPIEKEYDNISVSPKGNSLIETSSAGKSLKIIDLEFIYDIDISDLPLKGPADAPVIPARRCTCGYCTRFNGTWTSHPDAVLRLLVASEAPPGRYRFGTQTADFLFCGSCGVTVAAVCETGGRLRAVVTADHQLVTTGPYRWVRHPVYTALLGMLLATVLLFTEPWAAACALALYIVGTEVRVRAEDALLAGHFPEAWAACL